MTELRILLGVERVAIECERLPEDRRRQEYVPFLAEGTGGSPDIGLEVRVVPALRAEEGSHRLHTVEGSWDLYQAGEGYRLEVFEAGRALLKTQVDLDGSFSRGLARVERTEWTLAELLNPTLHLVVMHRLASSGQGLMLHALGVRFRGEGLLFVGPSGAGKSTLAKFFLARGAEVLCDECVVARRGEGAWWLHGTPFHGEVFEGSPGPARLRAVYLIRHRPEHVLEPLARGDLARLLVPQMYLPFWHARALHASLGAAGQLLGEVPAARLGFARSADVVDFLEDSRLQDLVSTEHAVEA